jgi:hypothetical protein
MHRDGVRSARLAGLLSAGFTQLQQDGYTIG